MDAGSVSQSFLMPSARLSVAPPASPTKDRYGSFMSKNKPASLSAQHLYPESQNTKNVSNTPTFPPGAKKDNKHKWVFPTARRTSTTGTTKKGGLSSVSEDAPSITVTPSVLMHHPLYQAEEPASPSAATLNGILQQLTPASTVPCMFVFFNILFTSFH